MFKRTFRNSLYGKHYLYCVAFNLVNLMIQVILTDLFLGGNFFTYGVVYSYSYPPGGEIPVQDWLFPKMSK